MTTYSEAPIMFLSSHLGVQLRSINEHPAPAAERLEAARRALRDATEVLHVAMLDALEAGGSWATIGAEMGVSKQTAHNRYSAGVQFERRLREDLAARAEQDAEAGQ